MRLLSLNCDHCGGPMTVPLKARYVTCQYCNSQLHIVRNESAAWTEVVEAIEEKTDALMNSVRALELRQEIQDLDAQWERTLDRYRTRNKNGEVSLPTRRGAWVGAIIACVLGVLVIHRFAPLIGIVVIAVGLIQMVVTLGKVSELERLQVSHQAKRRALLDELRELRGMLETASPSLSGDSLLDE